MRNPHPTKKGPGRLHKDGCPHGGVQPARKGAPLGFVQRRASAAKKLRRAQIAIFGRRQTIKAEKAERREPPPGGLL